VPSGQQVKPGANDSRRKRKVAGSPQFFISLFFFITTVKAFNFGPYENVGPFISEGLPMNKTRPTEK
jgi:hypothetical protein